MCGIFGYIGSRDDAATQVFDGLRRLEYRGYDSWGVAAVALGDHHEPIIVKKKVGKIGASTVTDMPKATLALGHTRWATHGGVTETNAHPHLDCSGTIAVVHNGIIENYSELKTRLIKKGHTFLSETDTEVLAHSIEEYRKTMPFAEAVRKTFLSLRGMNAFVAINQSLQELVAVRNGSPLVLGYGNDEQYIASDLQALLPHTKMIAVLENGQMAIIQKNQIQVFDVHSNKPVVVTKQHLVWNAEQAEKGKYRDFMLKEIYEQSQTLERIAISPDTSLERVADMLRTAHSVTFVGCGTASYACLAGAQMFERVAHRRAFTAIGSEFYSTVELLSSHDVIVAVSQSGETMDLLEPLTRAKTRKVRIVALVNVPGSSLERLANVTIHLGVGPEKAVASTKAFTAQLVYLCLLSYAVAGKLKLGKQNIAKAARATKTVLSSVSVTRIQTLAKTYSKEDHMYVIGRGLSYPLSLETALKIKEITYIHAEGFAAGELKHGTLALISSGTPCIAFFPDDETYAGTLANVMEVKARGGRIIGIAQKKHALFDAYIPIPKIAGLFAIPAVVFSQLFAYMLAVERGLDPDMPRNLAKSVTVK